MQEEPLGRKLRKTFVLATDGKTAEMTGLELVKTGMYPKRIHEEAKH